MFDGVGVGTGGTESGESSGASGTDSMGASGGESATGNDDASTTGDGDGDASTTGDGDGDASTTDDGDSPLDDCPVDDLSLVACYDFEDPDELIDHSNFGNHGEAAVLGLSEGLADAALDCEASEAVRVPDSDTLDLTDAITLAMWVRPDSYPEGDRAAWIDNSGQYGMMFDPNVGFVCRVLTSQGTNEVSAEQEVLPLEVWTHIACTYDGSKVRLYADATKVASTSAGGPISTGNSEVMTLGSNSPSFDERCRGMLDGVQIYKRALSKAELQVLAGE